MRLAHYPHSGELDCHRLNIVYIDSIQPVIGRLMCRPGTSNRLAAACQKRQAICLPQT